MAERELEKLQAGGNWITHCWATKGVNEDVKREIIKYPKANGNKNKIHQNLCDAEKVVLRGNFMMIHNYIL